MVGYKIFGWVGYSVIAISYLCIYLIGTCSYDYGLIPNYFVFYCIFINALISGCIALSIYSHKKLIIRDSKESFSSISLLLLDNASVIAGTILSEINIVMKLTSKLSDQGLGVAAVFGSSLMFVLSGLIGFGARRVFTNILTIISYFVLAFAFFILYKYSIIIL
ncbi:MAG: hypothetical protein Q4C15_11760 [Eubacteriales bacterium]|nr:hypothetical protein [Eubacteriales bacterium]